MKKPALLILLILLFSYHFCCYSQTDVEIPRPNLELKENNLIITFDINNSQRGDKFKISIEVTDSKGYVLNAQSLTGDIGENISGGDNKKITWDLTADNINMAGDIFIQVIAEVIVSPDIKPVKSISRTGAILQSVIFPGLGLSRINNGKPHWIKGVAGYGCLAGSIIYNRKAVSNYDKYLESFDISESDEFYNNSVNQDRISKVLAFTAAGIWVIDMVWVIRGSSKLKTQSGYNQARGFSISPGYNDQFNTTMITLTYNF